MKHFGDITKLKGNSLPFVDIITGGSPCQDLSVAGHRKGLLHADLGDGETTRSGLFMEQIRIIKEMRNESLRQLSMRRADVDIRLLKPRFMVWENVPGAFSSNKGEDFRAVLEETAKIADQNATIPRPSDGRWTPAGCIMGDGWSIAWRVHDAQFWGVPQRRKRIALVADFAGGGAPEILFECQGVRGYSAQSEETRQDTSKIVGADFDGASISFQERAGKPGGGKGILIQKDRIGTLSTFNNQSVLANKSIDSDNQPILLESNQNHATIQTDGISTALPAAMGEGGGYIPMITDTLQDKTGSLMASGYNKLGTQEAMNGMFVVDKGCAWDGSQISPTLTCKSNEQRMPDKNNFNAVIENIQGVDCYNQTTTGDKAMSITGAATDTHHIPSVMCLNDQGGSQMSVSEEKSGTLRAEEHGHQPIIFEPGAESRVGGHIYEDGVACTLRANAGDNQQSVCYGFDGYNQTVEQEVAQPLRASDGGDSTPKVVCYGLDRASFNQGQNAQYDFSVEEELAQTLVSKGAGGVLTQLDHCAQDITKE